MRYAVMTQKIFLAHFLKNHRVVSSPKSNMGDIEVRLVCLKIFLTLCSCSWTQRTECLLSREESGLRQRKGSEYNIRDLLLLCHIIPYILLSLFGLITKQNSMYQNNKCLSFFEVQKSVDYLPNLSCIAYVLYYELCLVLIQIS